MYTLNFSTPFNTTRDQNLTAIFGNFSKAPNGGAANNLAPNYYDGALLYNDNEYFMYGGLLMRNDQSPPPGGVVQAYQKFQYGPNKAAFYPGFVNDNLPNGLTRYLAYGGAASAPSENKAWYFGGLQSPSAGPIYEVSDNDTATAYNLSNTLITLDMSTQNSEVWSNSSLPPDISSRANPELVWVPVGAQGILVALGGVVYPDFIEVNAKSANESGSVGPPFPLFPQGDLQQAPDLANLCRRKPSVLTS